MMNDNTWFDKLNQEQVIKAASDAVGWDVDYDDLRGIVSQEGSRTLEEMKRTLEVCLTEFNARGGRGIELADQIDHLNMAIAVRELADEQEESNQLAEDMTAGVDVMDAFEVGQGPPTPPKVFVVKHDHKYGVDTYTYSTYDKAVRGAVALALDNMEEIPQTSQDEIRRLAKEYDFDGILEEWHEGVPEDEPESIKIEEVLPDEDCESDDHVIRLYVEDDQQK